MQKMYEVDHRYLKYVDFTQFEKWDVKRHYHKNNVKFSNEVVVLGNILKPYKKGINKEYIINNKLNIISKINFGGELFLRDFEEINTYKGNLFLVPENSIIYSKINVRHGCIYYHQKNGTPFAVSNEYPIYTFDEKRIDGRFIQKLIRSNYFKNLLNTKTSGISKARVKQDEFLDIQIPLPSIAEQKAILDDYQQKIENAKQLETKAQTLEQSIEKYLFEELGIVEEKRVKSEGVFSFVDFKNILKWGFDYNSKSENSLFKSKIFDNDKLKNVLDINPKTDLPNSDKNISFIPMECISDEYGEVMELREKKVEESKGYTKFKDGDLLWARITPCMQNGKSAIVKGLMNGIGCGSTEYHILRNSYNKVDLHFIYHFLRLPIVLKYATSFFTGSAGQQRVPKTFLEELSIPLPPLEKQKEIAEHISAIKDNIKSLKQNAETLKAEAEKEFEEKIFN